MKPTYPLLLLTLSLSHIAVAADAPPALPMRDAATHDDLSLRYKKAQENTPTSKFEPAKGEDPSKSKPEDLLSKTDALCYGGFMTIVPKNAIINLPESLKSRVGLQANHKAQNWTDFYTSNRGWLTTVEVTRSQAEGNAPLEEDTIKSLKDNPRIVVATYKGGPISVLPQKPKEEPKENKDSKDAKTSPSSPKK